MRAPAALLAVTLLAGCGEDVANCAALRASAPDRALEAGDRAAASRLVWSRDKARVRLNRGTLLAERGRVDEAISDFTRAIDSGRLEARNLVVAYDRRGAAQLQSAALEAAG